MLDTFIGDAENIYDLNRLDDQLLLLGIKGTLSVLELGTLKLRMQQGREAKARRGELGRVLAPGYVMEADQRGVLQYVAPVEFDKRLRAPLIAAAAAPATIR